MHEYVDASLSYTPYMFAKAETALRVDDSKGDGKPGEMDKAIYACMDNVASFNLPGAWQSIKKVAYLATHFERDLTVREGGVPVVKPQAAPSSIVQAGGIQHTPGVAAQRSHDVATTPTMREDSENTDSSWAQSIMDKQRNPAQIYAASATRH